jgi:hypothetical protein
MNFKIASFVGLFAISRDNIFISASKSKNIAVAITNTLDNVMNIYDNCPSEVEALESCYGGHESLTSCVNCAWTNLLDESEQPDCTRLHEVADQDYAQCTECNAVECNDELEAMLTCAVGLYCSESDDDVNAKLVNNFLRTSADNTNDKPELDAKQACFSLESNVVVKGKGITSIKDLVIGDMVLSDDEGTYSKYYSKGHYDENEATEFLRIHHQLGAKPLELTPAHMLYLASGKLPVPAHSVKIGDVIKSTDGPSKVTAIRKISRKGLANPLTLSGSIVVDGIVSSIHSEESGFEGSDAGWIYLSGIKIAHWHTLVHFIHAPHRIVCGRFMTCTEKLTEDGLVPFDQYLVNIHVAAEEKQSVVFSVFVLLLLVTQTIVFSALELLLQHAVAISLAAVCFMIGNWFVSKKFGNKAKVV